VWFPKSWFDLGLDNDPTLHATAIGDAHTTGSGAINKGVSVDRPAAVRANDTSRKTHGVAASWSGRELSTSSARSLTGSVQVADYYGGGAGKSRPGRLPEVTNGCLVEAKREKPALSNGPLWRNPKVGSGSVAGAHERPLTGAQVSLIGAPTPPRRDWLLLLRCCRSILRGEGQQRVDSVSLRP
jgi:hypothetical protein